MKDTPKESWEKRFDQKIKELGFHLGYLQKPQMEKLKDYFRTELNNKVGSIRAEIVNLTEPYDGSKWLNDVNAKKILNLPSLQPNPETK